MNFRYLTTTTAITRRGAQINLRFGGLNQPQMLQCTRPSDHEPYPCDPEAARGNLQPKPFEPTSGGIVGEGYGLCIHNIGMVGSFVLHPDLGFFG